MATIKIIAEITQTDFGWTSRSKVVGEETVDCWRVTTSMKDRSYAGLVATFDRIRIEWKTAYELEGKPDTDAVFERINIHGDPLADVLPPEAEFGVGFDPEGRVIARG